MGSSTRVPGHALRLGRRPSHPRWFGWRAECECGRQAWLMPTKAMVRQRHRQHKEEVEARG